MDRPHILPGQRRRAAAMNGKSTDVRYRDRDGHAQPYALLDPADDLRRYRAELWRPRRYFHRRRPDDEGIRRQPGRDGLYPVGVQLVLCAGADPRRLVAGPLRHQMGLCGVHPVLVAVHARAGLGRLHRRRLRHRHAVRAALPHGRGRGACLSRQCPRCRRVVPLGGTRHRLGHLQFGAVFCPGDFLSADELDCLGLWLARCLPGDGGDRPCDGGGLDAPHLRANGESGA